MHKRSFTNTAFSVWRLRPGHSNYQIGPNWSKSDQIRDTQYQIGAIL